MYKTSASLIFDDDTANGAGEIVEKLREKKYLSTEVDTQHPIRRSPGTRNSKQRPQLAVESNVTPDTYWREHVKYEGTGTGTREDMRRNANISRRKQPAIRAPLEALEKEQKLFELRDKQRQELRDKSYRRPYFPAKKELQDESTTETFKETEELLSKASTNTDKGPADFRNILKTSGNLSLSEILQQKNLSLDDLLKGKKNALLALQTTAITPAQKTVLIKLPKQLRRLPLVDLIDISTTTAATVMLTNKKEERTLCASEREEPQVKLKLKLPVLRRIKPFGSFSRENLHNEAGEMTFKQQKPGAINETMPTTTAPKRVPFHKKRFQHRLILRPPSLLKTKKLIATKTKETPPFEEMLTTKNQAEFVLVQDARADAFSVDVNETEQVDYDSTTGNPSPQRTFPRNRISAKGSFSREKLSAKGRMSTIKGEVSTSRTIAPDSVLLSFNTTASHTTPSRINFNPRDRFTERNFKSNLIKQHERSTEQTIIQDIDESHSSLDSIDLDEINPSVESITSRSEHQPMKAHDTILDIDGNDDRTDLLELIEDRYSSNRLFKVLEQRNMTLEELIEHRKRGSSQLHLSTIVQNRSRFYHGSKATLYNNMDIVTAFNNFPHFNLIDLKSVTPDDIKTDSQGSSYFTSIIDIESTDEVYRDGSDAKAGGVSGVKGVLSVNYLERRRRNKGAAQHRSADKH